MEKALRIWPKQTWTYWKKSGN